MGVSLAQHQLFNLRIRIPLIAFHRHIPDSKCIEKYRPRPAPAVPVPRRRQSIFCFFSSFSLPKASPFLYVRAQGRQHPLRLLVSPGNISLIQDGALFPGQKCPPAAVPPRPAAHGTLPQRPPDFLCRVRCSPARRCPPAHPASEILPLPGTGIQKSFPAPGWYPGPAAAPPAAETADRWEIAGYSAVCTKGSAEKCGFPTTDRVPFSSRTSISSCRKMPSRASSSAHRRIFNGEASTASGGCQKIGTGHDPVRHDRHPGIVKALHPTHPDHRCPAPEMSAPIRPSRRHSSPISGSMAAPGSP